MARAIGIGGVFIRADNPLELAKWYEEHLGIDQPANPWIQMTGPTVFAPFTRESEYFDTEKAFMLNFRVDELDELLAKLKEAGIEAETRDEWNSEIGRFARIKDPEGNPIELWEPAGPAKL